MNKRLFLRWVAGSAVGFLVAMLAVLVLYGVTAAMGVSQQLPSVIAVLVSVPAYFWARGAFISRSKRRQSINAERSSH